MTSNDMAIGITVKIDGALTNAELQQAIDQALKMVRSVPQREAPHEMLQRHLDVLLRVQQARASVVVSSDQES
jgi:hypothetical protein